MRQAPHVSVYEVMKGLGTQIGKMYAVFVIGVVIAVAAAAQIRFASLGSDWLPDQERRAYVEGLVLTGTVMLWIITTLTAGLIARSLLPSLVTVVATCVIFGIFHGTTDQELLRPLFDEPELSGFLGVIVQLLMGPLLGAPIVGAIASRQFWRPVAAVFARVPRKVWIVGVRLAAPVVALVVSDLAYASHLADEIAEAEIAVELPQPDSSWRLVPGTTEVDHVEGSEALGMYLARHDFTGVYTWATVRPNGADPYADDPHADDPATVHYLVQNGEYRMVVFIDQFGQAHPWLLDGRSDEDGSLQADLLTNLEPVDVDELVRANCWACLG